MSSPSLLDPSLIDTNLDCRAVTFENPSGERGSGGQLHGGRKGAPARLIQPGEKVVLADLNGPGTVRHVWMTFPPARPEIMRAPTLEVFYDGLAEPSISAPCLDFFGLPHGRPVPYDSALASAHEGRGFNAYLPLPFRKGLRVEFTNHAPRPVHLYYQIDYTLEPSAAHSGGYLHVTFRRENPTRMRQDFVISEGLRGPGRFAGCNVGVRVIDGGIWWGEGEVKVYRDGDGAYPTICGTGLEDYIGSAWGLGPFSALYAGAPLDVREKDGGPMPDFVGFYRWHLLDPVVFLREQRVTIQQIGYALFGEGQEEEFRRYERTNPPAGEGWHFGLRRGVYAQGIAERVDDYCATAYVYCREPQPVPRVDVRTALAEIERRPYEKPSALEGLVTEYPDTP
jgi:hypothetical protein